RIIGKQLIRSATSVAANYRAAIRARSMKEKYHKLCIVVEEADETVFWIELLQESNLIPNYDFQDIIQEANEIMKVMSTYRSRLKR
ncbi:MAG: four helix bundle protein, partial [Saprospiraceae bacterium]|nr:four helix bundle protein [Saprospiraceae bacterium]